MLLIGQPYRIVRPDASRTAAPPRSAAVRYATLAPPSKASMTRSPESAWPRGAVLALLALLAVHVVLAVVAIGRLPADSPYNPVDVTALRQLGLPALGVLAALAFAARTKPAFVLAMVLVASAGALLGSGALMAVVLVGLAATLVGDLVVTPASDRQPVRVDLALPCGLAILLALQSAGGTLRVHDRIAYVAVLVGIVVLRRERAAALLQQAAATLRASAPASPLARAWMAVLGALAFLHVVVVARPEVGFDALAMHLQFARIVTERHAWSPDVGRYAWSVMPLAADWLFATGNLLAGEAGARALNLAAAVLAARLLVVIIDAGTATRWPALAMAALIASAPLAFLVTGSLFSEALLCAFLLGTLVAWQAWSASRAPAALVALAWCAAGALQCKATAMLWVLPMAAGLVAVHGRGLLTRMSARQHAAVALAACAAAWPYVNAWVRTGNPVFPFVNGVFRSPLFSTDGSFNNPLYNAALRPWTPYEILLESYRFIEAAPGTGGAPGFGWLIVLPLVGVALALRRYRRLQVAMIALAAAFFVLVFLQQSYLRYLLPAIVVATIAAGWALNDLARQRIVAGAILVLGLGCIVVNLRHIDSGNWTNADLCRRCAFDAGARERYVARYAPLRLVAEWLQANVPDARVGFLVVGPSPAGYTRESRAAGWHDVEAYPGLIAADNADQVLGQVRRWRLTHVVFAIVPDRLERAMTEFGARHTRPIVEIGNYRIAEVIDSPVPAPNDRPRAP